MSTLYSTKVTATGGRHGHIRSDDGLLDMKLALPRELGGKGDATNPEMLSAGGYAACFENAFLRVSREKGYSLRTMTSKLSLKLVSAATTRANFVLSAAVTGVDQETAEEVAESAHQICPYSNAIRGNVEVRITVFAR